MNVYAFRVAIQTADELKALQEQLDFTPEKLVLTTLPDGSPSYKTIYVRAETEEDAARKADVFIKDTPYHEITDKKILT